jgi:hypothetical protein
MNKDAFVLIVPTPFDSPEEPCTQSALAVADGNNDIKV